MNLETLKQFVRQAGFRVSAECWEDEFSAHAFSVESFGPEALGNARFSAAWNKETGHVLVGTISFYVPVGA